MVTTEVKRKVLGGWDGLIGDANRQIVAAKQRIVELKKAVKNLEAIRDSGQPWPGSTQANNQTNSEHHTI